MIPDELLERFRVLSLERVGRVDTSWNRLVLVREGDDSGLLQQMLREIHTLKGDASIVRSLEVQRLCHKLEDLLEVADESHFEISEDFEFVVTMAIQFLGMLLRVKPGAMAGLDLDGFVRQVDDVLRETRTLPAMRARRTSLRTLGTDAPLDRVGEHTRQRLAAAATNAFLEYLSARGQSSRARLRGVWTAMRDELARMQVTPLQPLLERHVAAANELALGVGKRITLELAVGAVGLEPRAADAVDIAVLHLIRNAIDHGLESPAERIAAGKAEAGRICVHASERGANIEIAIEDDGRGVDFVAVRARAAALGLDPARDDTQLLPLLFEPGFSTRTKVTALSGRGVGLDAVKVALERIGGSVRITSHERGTTVTLAVRALVRQLHAYHFLAPGGTVSLAVSARWTPSLEATPHADSIDPLQSIQLFGGSRQTSLEAAKPGGELSFRLRWGFLELSLRSATEPVLASAERICPTPDDHPVEIVTIDGQETILIRPEHLGGLAAAWPARVLTSS